MKRVITFIKSGDNLKILLGIALLFTVAGLVAALIPVLSLRRIDPLEAFRP